MTILVLTKSEFKALYNSDPNLQTFIKDYIDSYASKVRKTTAKTFLTTIQWDKHEYKTDYRILLAKTNTTYDAITFTIRTNEYGIFNHLPVYYSKRRSWYVYGTWVHPNQRNKGLNKLLLDHIQAYTKASFLLAVIHNTNEASKRSFLKSGFIVRPYKSPYSDSQWYVKAFSK